MAPALGLPDYHQPFHLHVHERDGFATGILVQKHGSHYRPVAYYSSRLTPVVLDGASVGPLLFTLLTHDCSPTHNTNLFVKFADDTTVVGLINKNDESNYRDEVSRLAKWCRDNNLSLNVEKTKEIVVDFRRAPSQHHPLTINGAAVERVSSTRFLGVLITEDLSWSSNTASLTRKAQQRLYFLRRLRRARAPVPILKTFYRGTTESILTSCITVWYGSCTASCKKTLQRIVRAAERIIGAPLPSLQDIYSTRLARKAISIAGRPHPPQQPLLQPPAFREENEEPPGENQQTERQLHAPGHQDAELPPSGKSKGNIAIDCEISLSWYIGKENPCWCLDRGKKDDSSLSSGCSFDTDILSSSESSSSRSSAWPVLFQVPRFSYDTELQLDRANAAFKATGTLLNPDTKLKSAILNGLTEMIITYKVYLSDSEFENVAEALILKHPCLKEPGSVSGYSGWKTSLKYKLGNYRTKLRELGCSEVTVNALKQKPHGKCSPAYAVKKPKKAEVIYCPAYPTGETTQTLEMIRVALLSEVQKRNNDDKVVMMMDKTFALRREEVVREAPMIADFKTRWPALFNVQEVSSEFKRITTLHLQSKFFSELDACSAILLKAYSKKGGVQGKKIKSIMVPITQTDSVDVRRECVLKGLCVYLNEDPEKLVKEYMCHKKWIKSHQNLQVGDILLLKDSQATRNNWPMAMITKTFPGEDARFQFKKNLQYIGAYPPLHNYGVERMTCAQQQEFYGWYREVSQGTFDFEKEARLYCENDVDILAKGCVLFRNQFLTDTGVDPLAASLSPPHA
ncbi:putative RNA-directed DNA polymerase from transposon BS [Collichthys lucidus]|uniref:Putative RNA-directed DNA polymerase from transposon BS n=1 Tax=Collichthys lucidus TaxID=240159 RepID=A0A4U5TVX1_COLLU|nr:putative RNA-directed DNA polymerase from transposon BS [Collichthys lucidus]